jgi:rubredoxin
VAFEALPETWMCPVCGSPKSAFKKTVSAQAAQPLDTWTCSVCAHVYDQVKDGGGVAFEDQPDTYKCPVCGSPKSAFQKSVSTRVAQPVSQPLDTWTCSVCAHVYDQVKDGGGVAFEDQPDTWKCPVCGSPKSAFKKSVEAPALSTISSCGKATDHIPDFKIASSGGVITMTGTLDEGVTKASIDLDVSLHVLIINLPLKMSIPLAVSDGLIKKGAISSTVGPSTISVSPQVKATIKGTMKINDGNGDEITCLNLDTSAAEIEKAVIINV